MSWNWQLDKWPDFQYDASELIDLEKKFLQAVGGGFAILKHLENEKKKLFVIEMLSTEGEKSAEIEGEILERESLQISIQKHFGLRADVAKVSPQEEGMGELMWNVYSTFDKPLTHEMLYEWHKMLMQGEASISNLGAYRIFDDPMQIIAGRYDKHEVHFEAPPSKRVYEEMARFIEWFNHSNPNEPVLAKAAIMHLYFESIHPFEDGNGRIGRALVEKILSKSLGHPTLIAVSETIARRKKNYYVELGRCNRTLDVQEWVVFFSGLVLQAQKESFSLISFLMAKSVMMNQMKGQINPRQEKVLLRMFNEGIDGFKGGLSAENYVSITKTSKATATRDLVDLVEKGAFYKTGQLKHSRYWLNTKISLES